MYTLRCLVDCHHPTRRPIPRTCPYTGSTAISLAYCALYTAIPLVHVPGFRCQTENMDRDLLVRGSKGVDGSHRKRGHRETLLEQPSPALNRKGSEHIVRKQRSQHLQGPDESCPSTFTIQSTLGLPRKFCACDIVWVRAHRIMKARCRYTVD